MNQSDKELAALLATHPDEHFQQLVLNYQHRLYTFMFRQTGNAADAEDIAQDTLVRAYYALKNYPQQQVRILKLWPWLIKIALNVFYNRMRRPVVQSVSLDTPENSPLLDLEDQTPTPEEEAWRHKRRDRLEELVASLPEHYRVVINLYYFEELTYQEIANLLNQPMGTIKARLHRGIALLRKTLSTVQQDSMG